MRQLVFNCIQWLSHRQKISAVRAAHKKWGDGWVAPDRLPLSSRLDLARSHAPFNAHLMEEMYAEILRLCARPIEKSPWMWVPLNLFEELEQHLDACDNSKKRKAMHACAQWMTQSKNLRRTVHV